MGCRKEKNLEKGARPVEAFGTGKAPASEGGRYKRAEKSTGRNVCATSAGQRVANCFATARGDGLHF